MVFRSKCWRLTSAAELPLIWFNNDRSRSRRRSLIRYSPSTVLQLSQVFCADTDAFLPLGCGVTSWNESRPPALPWSPIKADSWCTHEGAISPFRKSLFWQAYEKVLIRSFTHDRCRHQNTWNSWTTSITFWHVYESSSLLSNQYKWAIFWLLLSVFSVHSTETFEQTIGVNSQTGLNHHGAIIEMKTRSTFDRWQSWAVDVYYWSRVSLAAISSHRRVLPA